MIKTVDRPPLSNLVRDFVRQYILDHNLAAGDPLPSEAQLADAIGVGRSSVREATKLLQSLGIVEIRQGFGLFVGPFSFEPIIDAFGYGMRIDRTTLAELAQIRYYLEYAAIGDAMARLEPADIAELNALMDDWRSIVSSGQADVKLDEQFHRILYRRLDNHAFVALFEAFWTAFHQVDDPVFHRARSAWEDFQHHHQVLDAIKTGDVEYARQRLMQHFHQLRQDVSRVKESQSD